MKISLIIPTFNEEDSIPLFITEVDKYLNEYNVEMIFINDGSRDNTENILTKYALKDERIIAINLSCNVGKEPALFAGLEYCTGNVAIPIDVDLQDPVSLIPLMIEKWKEGFDIVLPKRVDRSSDHFFKRKTAEWFYSLHNKISKTQIEHNVGDFRLMDRKVVDAVIQFKEVNLFMKGLLALVGFKRTTIEYKREVRIAGKSKFNALKLWNLALEGITSFSTFPLKIWTYFGFSMSFFAFVYGVILIFQKIFLGNPIPGYPSLLVSILFIGGAILMGIGVIGEYIGRIYLEVKQRPRYIVSSIIRKNKE